MSEVHVSVAVEMVHAEFRRQHPELRRVSLLTRYYPPLPGFVHDGVRFEPGLSDMITIDLRNIPADEALRYLAKLCNYRFEVSAGSIYFGDIPEQITLLDRLAAIRGKIRSRLRNE